MQNKRTAAGFIYRQPIFSYLDNILKFILTQTAPPKAHMRAGT